MRCFTRPANSPSEKPTFTKLEPKQGNKSECSKNCQEKEALSACLSIRQAVGLDPLHEVVASRGNQNRRHCDFQRVSEPAACVMPMIKVVWNLTGDEADNARKLDRLVHVESHPPTSCTKNSPLPAGHLLCDRTLVILPSTSV